MLSVALLFMVILNFVLFMRNMDKPSGSILLITLILSVIVFSASTGVTPPA